MPPFALTLTIWCLIGLASTAGALFAPSLKVTSMNAKGEVTAVCHSNIINGEFHYANDCTHAMVGQIVPVPDWTPV